MNKALLCKLLNALTLGSLTLGAWCYGWIALPESLKAIAQNVERPLEPETSQIEPGTSDIQRHTIALTVSDMSQVKVTKDQCLAHGEIVADRHEERQKLQVKRDQRVTALEKLSASLIPPAPPQEPAYALEQANVAAAQAMVDYWQSVPLEQSRFKTEALIATLDRDLISRNQQLQENRLLAQTNLNQAIAALQAAQSSYQEALYNHSIRVAQHQEKAHERQIDALKIQDEIEVIETQLQEVTIVSSPYAGKVRAVRIQSQQNRTLTVEVMLLQGECE